MDWDALLRISHIIGTVLGVGGVTFADIFFLKAARDGKIDPHESETIRTVSIVLRIGLVLLVISGFGFLVYYRLAGFEARLMSPRLWAKLTIVFVILINGLLLEARKIPIALGGPFSTVSWWAALILGVWRIKTSYFALIGGYLVFVFLGFLALTFIKKRLKISL